jgi:hypothetical protein
MKTRLAKKILLGPDKGKNGYWLKRVIRAAMDWKEDHRVANALRIYHRKRRRKEVSYE